MKAVKEINIYLLKKRNAQSIDVVQYDTGIQLVFKVLDFDIPAGTTATLYVQKPSGEPVYQEKNITVADNTIVIDLENQAISEHGKASYQITLINGNDEISTFSGILNVEKRVVNNENAVESSTVATVKLNEFATGIKGHLSGVVVTADDVSPIAHRPKVKVICPDGVEPAAVTVTRCGKNIFDITADELTVVGSSGSQRYAIVFDVPATYTFSCVADPTVANISYKIVTDGEYGEYLSFVGDVKFTVTIAENQKLIIYKGQEGERLQAGITNAQLEMGNTATEYEQYNGSAHIPNADGTVYGITSLSPVMTLSTDTEGVTIECEYIKDTNKVIAKIADAINAMGGEITI